MSQIIRQRLIFLSHSHRAASGYNGRRSATTCCRHHRRRRSRLPDRSSDWRSVTRPFFSRMCKDYIQKLSQRQTPSKSSLGSLLGTLVTLLEPLGSLLGAPWAHLTFQNEAQKLLKSALEDLLDPLGCLLRPCWKNIKKNVLDLKLQAKMQSKTNKNGVTKGLVWRLRFCLRFSSIFNGIWA